MANTGRRYTHEQIIAILKEAEAAKSAAEVIRRHGVTAHTYYRWKAKFAGMKVSDARRLKALEDENRQLRKLVAQQALDNQILKEPLGKDRRRWRPGAPPSRKCGFAMPGHRSATPARWPGARSPASGTGHDARPRRSCERGCRHWQSSACAGATADCTCCSVAKGCA